MSGRGKPLLKIPFAITSGFAVLLFCISFAVQGQMFFVSFVKGNVTRAGMPLKTGDVLQVNDTETLEFGTLDDLVVVVSGTKGRFAIKAKTIVRSENRLWILVKDNLVPCTQTNSLNTRSLDNIMDIKEYLEDGRLTMVDRILVPLDKSFWDDREQNYFYINYTYRNNKIEKILPFKEPLKDGEVLSLVIDNGLFIANDQKVNSGEIFNMALYYLHKEFSQASKISDLKIVKIAEEPVLSELKIIYAAVDEFFNHDRVQTQKEIEAHIQEFYGKTDAPSINKLMTILAKDVQTK